MKKALLLGLIALFATALLAQGAFAFGDCNGKVKKTKVADTTKSDKDSS